MFQNDPWKEPQNVDRAHEIRCELELARRAGQGHRANFPKLLRELDLFLASLMQFQDILTRRPDAWRSARSLIVVDIPTVIEVLNEAATLPDGDAKAGVTSNLAQSLGKIAAGFDRVSDQVAVDLALTLSVNNQALPAPDVNEPASEPASGMFGRLKGLSRSAVDLADGAVKGAGQMVGDAYTATSAAAGTAAARAGAVSSLATEELTSTLLAAGRSVTRPVTKRIGALSAASAEASVYAIIFGGLASVILPPLAPLVVGEAVLGMGEGYARNLAQMDEADARDALRRSGQREERISDIIAAIKGGPIRFETDYVSITVDPITDEKSGIVLQGLHMGKDLTSLEASDVRRLAHWAPDEATARALSAWMG